MEKKGFTLVELLVVVGILMLLVALIMPALSKAREAAQRAACAMNLSSIGRAMIIYCNDNNRKYPRAGYWTSSGWSTKGYTANFDSKERPWGSSTDATITSSLYLLVKYADVTPSRFICKGDEGARAFDISHLVNFEGGEIVNFEGKMDERDLWDFGDAPSCHSCGPGRHCSYAYHMPYTSERLVDGDDTVVESYPLSSENNPESPVCADRNPYLDRNAKSYIDGADPYEDAPWWNRNIVQGRYEDPDLTGNSALHKRGGQNVLFVGGHVKFCKYPNVGIYSDNIWKCWQGDSVPEDASERELGPVPYTSYLNDDGQGGPRGIKDAYLVSEKN
jgi:prepilin-type processing-associated H-X9-DG protein